MPIINRTARTAPSFGPVAYAVTGTSDQVGNYHESGTGGAGSAPAYVRTDGAYWIWEVVDEAEEGDEVWGVYDEMNSNWDYYFVAYGATGTDLPPTGSWGADQGSGTFIVSIP